MAQNESEGEGGGVRSEIRFLLNGGEIRLSDAGPSDTLLDWLRLEQRLCGTKEGCAEGDCGACTVLIGRLRAGELIYETVNACIRLLPSLDGCHVVTVEHLRGETGGPHPVQQAMVDAHASQCGFCTPGFVMSLYALWRENPAPGETEIETALQGNLCRCTGYAPIVRAAQKVGGDRARDFLALEGARTAKRLAALRDGRRVVTANNGARAVLPASADDLAAVLMETPGAVIVSGATDVGLWVTKSMRDISPAVFIAHLDELKTVTVEDDGALVMGACATYSDAEPAVGECFPHLSEYWRRIGGPQVRNMGAVGANIANGSPIGDTPPVFIALGADITLRRGDERRTLPLEKFFIDYGKQDRTPGEFIESVRIPKPAAGALHAAYKVSKRRDEDISSVCAGFYVVVKDGVVTEARLAFGGMAATPKRAAAAEAALQGQAWSKQTVRTAMAAMAQDFTPVSDWRASADYRAAAARNLLLRFFLEHDAETDTPVRLSA